MHCLSCYAQIAGRDAAILIMKQNATVKAAQSYLYILGGVTDLSLEKTWLFFLIGENTMACFLICKECA